MKNFENCLHGGLKKPSHSLVKTISSFEKYFLKNLKTSMTDDNIRKKFAKQLVQLVSPTDLKDDNCNCQTIDLVIHCFISVRLHHEIRMMNEAIAQEKNTADLSRKNRKLMKVSHK